MPSPDHNLTVCIPTYFGAPSIINTVQSILASDYPEKIRFIVNVDGNPLKPDIENKLKEMGIEVIFAPIRGGQVARLNQMAGLTTSEYIIFTQDDVIFDTQAINRIMQIFETNPHISMSGARILPSKASSFFEHLVEIGVTIGYRIGMEWNGGDNYLLASGRCLAFRTAWLKKHTLPEEIINSDAYLYFVNKKTGGKFVHASDAIVYNHSPKSLREHLKQAKKFQISQKELEKHMNTDLDKEFTYPLYIGLKSVIKTFLTRPIYTLFYLIMHFYTIIAADRMYANAKRFWDTDVSTKTVSNKPN